VPATDGTVYDKATQLTWQAAPPQGAISAMGLLTFMEAEMYCINNEAGLPDPGTGWRLPTIGELQSLLDRKVASGPRIASWAFPNTPITSTALYWTSTVVLADTGKRWAVSFSSTNSATFNTEAIGPFTAGSELRVRCVRP
jgi:hypothetical protein